MLSDDTIKRMKSLMVRVDEVMKAFDGVITRQEAWNMVTAESGIKAAEVAERIEARQKKQQDAELRSLAARASTYKSNIDGDL